MTARASEPVEQVDQVRGRQTCQRDLLDPTLRGDAVEPVDEGGVPVGLDVAMSGQDEEGLVSEPAQHSTQERDGVVVRPVQVVEH
ncbi:MAG: hypothetical protein KDB35_15475, partial [Acidimicrobiales bacterium]|nr:hypothetical protein [Acidimicrobiales bacterium]